VSQSVREPLPLRWLSAHGIASPKPWYLTQNDKERDKLRDEYRLEFLDGSRLERDIHPFAQRRDQDDIAGFEVVDGELLALVLVVHLTWKGTPEALGYPRVERFDDFWHWLKTAIDDTALSCSEEDLAEILVPTRSTRPL